MRLYLQGAPAACWRRERKNNIGGLNVLTQAPDISSVSIYHADVVERRIQNQFAVF